MAQLTLQKNIRIPAYLEAVVNRAMEKSGLSFTALVIRLLVDYEQGELPAPPTNFGRKAI